MNNRTIVFFALLILCPVVIYFLWPSDESRIKKLFREGSKAIEQENMEDVMSKISFNYRDRQGFAYLSLKEGMNRVFRQMSGIKIEYDIKKISVKDDSADVDLDLRVIASYGQDTGYVVGDAAEPAHMRFSLEKTRTAWLVAASEGLQFTFQLKPDSKLFSPCQICLF